MHTRAREEIKGLSLKVMREYTRGNGRLKAYLNRLLAPPSIPPRQQEWQEKERAYTEEKKQQEEQWLEYIRSNEAALRENRAPPALLHQMAIRYFGDSINVHNFDGSKDIELELIDPSLINAALLGIRKVIDREDVPDVKEIFAIREKGHWHYLGFPFLASLAKIEEVAPEELCRPRRKSGAQSACIPLLVIQLQKAQLVSSTPEFTSQYCSRNVDKVRHV